MFNSNSCRVCNESISDPICRDCYIKQIRILLNDLPIHLQDKEIILNMIKNEFLVETLNDTECILCKQKDVILCRYCFSKILVNILKEMNFTEDLIESFGYNIIDEENNLKIKEDQIKIKI